MGLSPVMSVAKDFSGIRSRRDFGTDRHFHVTLQRWQTAGERPELGLVGVSPCCPSAKRRLAMQRAPPQPIFLPSPVTRAELGAPAGCHLSPAGRHWGEAGGEREGTAPPCLLPVSGTVTQQRLFTLAAAAGSVVPRF